MCFRPASTTMGARICTGCYSVVDDVEAEVCPQCGKPLEKSFANEGEGGAPTAPTAPSAPAAGAPGSAPSAPPKSGE